MGQERGVTLVELLIVVAIAGVMASIVLPSFTSGLDNMRLAEASDSTAAFLNGALNRVERRQQAIELAILPRENLIGLRSADDTFRRKLELPDGIRVEAVLPAAPADGSGARRFLLLPGGVPPRIGVQLVNRRSQRKIISVDPITGVPRIDRPANP